MTKTVVAGALGECVHVAGVSNFLAVAWKSVCIQERRPYRWAMPIGRRSTEIGWWYSRSNRSYFWRIHYWRNIISSNSC